MKVNISPSQGWTVQKQSPVKAAPIKKAVPKKVKAKLNTAAKKAFFPAPKYTVPKYPNA